MRILGEQQTPEPSRRPVLPFALAAVALAAAAGTVYWLARRPARPSSPRPSPQAPATTAAATAGALEVVASAPGATVWLDGRRLGPAPQRAADLAPGAHAVRVETEGYPPFEQEVHVLPGRETRITARLLAEPRRLRIDSDVPGASVFVDRKYVGVTPVEVAGLAPGTHRLNVSADGYEMYGDTIEISADTPDVMVRFKEVRLDESLEVVHKHGLGSCQGRLTATPAGLRYEASRREDSFEAPLGSLERFEVDYLRKNLRVTLRGGRSYNFTTRDGNADALLAFQKKVEAARRRLSG